ncbi:MAG: FG-GAP-like repeat-containing protein [Saprospiraceae bacterium]|nr:FG-GAP-like repeat-containing protein [Saprospiraceae bacterium]
MLFGNEQSVSFLKANSNGSHYTETVMPGYIFSQRSTMADINNDGWLDGFVCHDLDQSVPYKNDGEGNMTPDINLIRTADRPGSYSAIWTDYDNDNDIDLYITKCQGGAPPGNINCTNLLYRNNGNHTFSEVGALTGVDDNAQSWSTVFEDFDNDGDFDAFIVNHDSQNRLFRNNGDGTFTDVISMSGINPSDLGAYENAAGDFNNDGFIDIFSQLQNELYLGNGDLTFTGIDAPVMPGAIADLNNDGFLDVFRLNQAWVNQPNNNHWIKTSLFGIASNRNGIGARIEIYGPWGRQIREVRSGQSYSPMSSLNAHFGLGPNEILDSLKVYWPSGMVTRLFNLTADSLYLIPELPCMAPPNGPIVEGSKSICPNTTVQLLAAPGFSNYLWSNNQTGQILSVSDAGHYYAICTDLNGCASLTQPVDIEVIADVAPLIFLPEGNVICEGDTLILTASEGENYTWSNGVTGTQTLEVTQTGEYSVAIDALCFEGQLESNPLHVEVLSSAPPVVEDVVILAGDSVLLTAEGVNCEWYDQPFGGALLYSGSTFQTMPLSDASTYYVESHFLYPGSLQDGGKPDSTGDGGIPSQGGYLFFEAWQPFTLISVTVYVPEGGALGSRFVQLWSGDSLFATMQFELHPGVNVFELNFTVPVGQFTLQCQQGNLWRNSGALDYPYPIGDAGQITTSSFGNNFYYYFYDWKIRTQDFECISARTEVNVILSGIENMDLSSTVKMFPNPTSGLLRVDLEDNLTDAGSFRILDSYGRVVVRENFLFADGIQISLEPFPAGLYLFQWNRHGKIKCGKIVKFDTY